MKYRPLAIPEIAVIGVTRAMAGAGLALLLGHRLSPCTRKALGWGLFLTGAASTIPLVAHVLTKPSARAGRTQRSAGALSAP